MDNKDAVILANAIDTLRKDLQAEATIVRAQAARITALGDTLQKLSETLNSILIRMEQDRPSSQKVQADRIDAIALQVDKLHDDVIKLKKGK